jgi:hypothetical protein
MGTILERAAVGCGGKYLCSRLRLFEGHCFLEYFAANPDITIRITRPHTVSTSQAADSKTYIVSSYLLGLLW